MNALGRRMFKVPNVTWHYVTTVDPGLGGTGAALWEEIGANVRHGVVAPISTYKIVEPSGDWHDRLHRITDRLAGWLQVQRTKVLVLEMPRLWKKSAKSQGAAGSGDLFKLSALTGAIIYAARTCGVPVAEVYPDEWKGQLDDRLVHARIYKRLGLEFPTHVHDAVGMGLALQRAL